MKRYFLRDVARNFRSPATFRYMIAVLRKLGGVHARECNLCGYRGLFRAIDHPPRYDSQCPICRSEERHRLIGLLLQREPELGHGRVIHFAPQSETGIGRVLKHRSRDYCSADRSAGGIDRVLDIRKLDLPARSVDLFVVNHVLEHVDDDRRALAEMHRCLKPGGCALITVPMVSGWERTYEDRSIAEGASERERQLHFGQGDHVRYYGGDLRDRIKAAGFRLSEFTAAPGEVLRHGLIRGETVFVASRPA